MVFTSPCNKNWINFPEDSSPLWDLSSPTLLQSLFLLKDGGKRVCIAQMSKLPRFLRYLFIVHKLVLNHCCNKSSVYESNLSSKHRRILFYLPKVNYHIGFELEAGEDENGVTISYCLPQIFFLHIFINISVTSFLSFFICTFWGLYLGLENLCGKSDLKLL